MILKDVLKKNRSLDSIHSGRRCFIVGNGPSIKSQDITLLKNEITITASSFFRHPDAKTISPDYWVLADPLFWEKPDEYFNPLMQLAIDKAIAAKLFVPTGGISFYSSIKTSPLIDPCYFHYDVSKDIDSLIDFTQGIPAYGQNVISVSMMLAFYLGCNPIYLIGCDHDFMKTTKDEYAGIHVKHFYHNQDEVKCSGLLTWGQWSAAMLRMAYEYEQLKGYASFWGFQIFNATRDGCLDIFSRVEYESLFTSGSRTIDTKHLLSAIPDIISTLGRLALKLMREDEYASALVLLDEAISQNVGKRSKVEGLDYLRCICLLGLGEHREATKSARQDYLCNPSNQENSLELLKALGDDLKL